MEQISITRGLRELKLLNDRIEKQINAFTYVDAYQNRIDRTIVTKLTKNQFESDIKAGYQSTRDLIDRRNELKKKILLSNSTTKIKIGKIEMTVVEAIEYKNSIAYDKALLKKLKKDYIFIKQQIDTYQAELDKNIRENIKQNYGTEKQISKEDYDNIANPLLNANKLNIIDPLDIKVKIEKLTTKIEDFESNIDIVLSEINSKTMIEI